MSIQQNIQHQNQQQHNLVQIPSNTQQLIPLDGLQMVDGQQVRIIQQPQNKLEGITTIFNRQNNQVEKVEIIIFKSIKLNIFKLVQESAQAVQIDRSQMVGIQQPDGQIVMVIPNGQSPTKNTPFQPRLISLSEGQMLQPIQEKVKILIYTCTLDKLI